ncbi:MAG TPA: hypothetical protein VHN17_14045 [Steroidobacteraceae bacterium]|jgi:hypothetical protein|nr:hypothetical protein [Steroidobacteraceae bacterium]
MGTFVRRNLIYTWLTAISVILAIIGWGRAAAERQVTSFAEIDVQRINVREPDGTLRMTISSSATAPGLIFKGIEHPFPNRQAAGILFFDDEGTENGGLLFGGAKKGQNASSGGHLSFDQYQQDQVISLDQTEEHGRRRAGLTFFDRPSAPIPLDLLDRINTQEGSDEFETLSKAGGFGYARLFIGKNEERDSTVILRDARGLARLKLTVTPAGAASIEFMNETGKIVRRITEK